VTVKPLLDVLQEGGVLSPSRRAIVEGFSRAWNVPPYHAMLEARVFSRGDLAKELARCLGLEYIRNLAGVSVPREAFHTVPYNMARDFGIFPIGWIEDPRSFCCAVSDPTDPAMREALEGRIQGGIQMVVGEHAEIMRAITRQYPIELQVRCR
jgi:hypothetical protein